ncbi:hypothetical protein FC697_19705 [Bacillus wiedmannii]|nr:hypothetical protein FC697_19705 [Bacillus wiedmannii]
MDKYYFIHELLLTKYNFEQNKLLYKNPVFFIEYGVFLFLNKRDVYVDSKSNNLYALYKQHGRFEVLNKKGKHQGEVDFNLNSTKCVIVVTHSQEVAKKSD